MMEALLERSKAGRPGTERVDCTICDELDGLL